MIFDATNIQPTQGGGGQAHEIGLWDFRITNTQAQVPSKGNPNNKMFIVEFTSPVGKIEKRYNLWNDSQQAVDIAAKELSALCHATGVFRLNLDNHGAELRNAVGKIQVDWQWDSETKKPSDKYVEVKKVFDARGNEPGKPPQVQTAAPAQQPLAPPMTQQANGGWGAASAPAAQPAPAPQQAWGGQAPAANPAPVAAPAQAGAWQPGANAAPATPPWGQR